MSILKFILILILMLLMNSSLYSKDTTEVVIFQPSVRVGFDVATALNRIWQPEVRELEFSLDGEFMPNWFIAAEAGHLDIQIERESFDYNSNGVFFRVGADYNVLRKRDDTSNDVIILFARYGFATLTHSSDRIQVSNQYWGDLDTSFSSEKINSHWVELGFSIKAELYRNIFIGWAVRGKYLLYRSRDSLVDPYLIPGFGSIGKNNTAYSMHYGIYYRIPY